MSITFKTTILKDEHISATGIQVPDEIITALDKGKKPPVKVTIGAYTYRTTVAVMDGKYMVLLSRENREAAGVKGGDQVDVTIELDTEPRTVEVPDDLAAALAEKPGVREAFDKSNYSSRKEFVRQVQDAKTQETRERRIAGIVTKLGGS